MAKTATIKRRKIISPPTPTLKEMEKRFLWEVDQILKEKFKTRGRK